MRRNSIWVILLFMATTISFTGCGKLQTEIVQTSYLLNTDDTGGPYRVITLVTGDARPITVSVVYSTDSWKTNKTIEMTEMSDEVYVGQIPGQPAKTTVNYYITVTDSEDNTSSDPVVAPPDAKGSSYRFQILP